MTLKEKNICGPVKTIIERGANWADECIVVQDFNTNGQLKEIRYFYDKLKFDSIEYSEYIKYLKSLKSVNDISVFLDSSIFMIPNYYDGLDTQMMRYSHKTCFEYTTSGKLKKKTGFKVNNEIYFLNEYYYDSKDSLKKELFFSTDTLNNLTKWGETYYKYKSKDTKTRILKKTQHFYPKRNQFFMIIENTLQNDTLIQKFKNINNEKIWLTKYKYDHCHNNENYFAIKEEDTVLVGIKNVYFKNSFVDSQVNCDYYNGFLERENIIKYSYDSTGILMNTTEIDSTFNNIHGEISITQFDSNGNPILITENDKDTTWITYKYDRYKNWITSKKLYTGGGNKEIIENRIIVTY